MKNLFILFLIFSFAIAAFSQKPQTNLTKASAGKRGDEKSDFENASKISKAAEKIGALQKFIEKYPNSAQINRAKELIISARAAIADEKLKAGDFAGATELFKIAINEAPTPISNESFVGILSFPQKLYLYGQIIPAYDLADLIQERAAGNRDRLLALATFYIQVENGVYAKKLAEQAIELDPNFAKSYQTLGLANRLIFFLDDAADAYRRAAELEGEEEASAKRDLADLKRGLGKTDEAIEIYRQILEKFPEDAGSMTGLTLALFDAGRQAEAEEQMRKTLDIDSNNMTLLVGAAYWYVLNNQPDKALNLTKEAIVIEPRYVWSYIAMARALMLKKKPFEAEKVLLNARQYGNFPTLSYEIAAVRMQVGFYREAANELAQTFKIKDGILQTKLGGRVTAESDNFIELLQLERQASIFQPVAADKTGDADKLKFLLAFSSRVNSENADNENLSEAADNFIDGTDKMKFHRQIFAATRLLETGKNTTKAKEIVKSAIPLLDSSLNVENPAAAVLADELYEPRNKAIKNGELIITPSVPKDTLQTVLRGKIEELAGWAEQQEENPERAIVHFKRGLSILPKDSAMWHSTMWRMGAALQAQGKSKEALDAYIQSYQGSAANAGRYFIIETLYRQINGTTDGLEKKVGKRPETFDNISAIANSTVVKETTSEPENAEAKNETDKITKTPETETPAVKPDEIPLENLSVNEPQSETKTPTETVVEDPPVVEETKISTEKLPEVKLEDIPEKQIETQNKTDVINTAENQVSETGQVSVSKPENNAETADDKKPAETTKPPKTDSQKSLFEPIIIGIPKTETPKSSKTVPEKTDGLPKEESTKSSTGGETRQRIIAEKKSENSITEPCKVIVTQENVSLINDGGNLGILVALENAPEDTQINAFSSSPNDVRAVLEPEIGAGVSNRRFFIISSISKNKGLFSVTFETACGKKEISVNVR